MNIDSPFEQWRLKHMRGTAASRDIMELLALAFEGGRAVSKPETSDDLLRQSEREGWRFAKECEAEIRRLKELAEYRLKLLMQMPENKPWVGLTGADIKKVFEMDWNNPNCPEWVVEFSKRIEAKLKERNT